MTCHDFHNCECSRWATQRVEKTKICCKHGWPNWIQMESFWWSMHLYLKIPIWAWFWTYLRLIWAIWDPYKPKFSVSVWTMMKSSSRGTILANSGCKSSTKSKKELMDELLNIDTNTNSSKMFKICTMFTNVCCRKMQHNSQKTDAL